MHDPIYNMTANEFIESLRNRPDTGGLMMTDAHGPHSGTDFADEAEAQEWWQDQVDQYTDHHGRTWAVDARTGDTVYRIIGHHYGDGQQDEAGNPIWLLGGDYPNSPPAEIPDELPEVLID